MAGHPHRLLTLLAMFSVGLCLRAETQLAESAHRHSLEYLDHFYSGMLALHRSEPAKARGHFREACALELPRGEPATLQQRVEQAASAAVEEPAKGLDFPKIAGDEPVIWYYCVSELLARSAAVSEAALIHALDTLLGQESALPQSRLPREMVPLLHAYRLRASGTLTAETPATRDKAVLDFEAAIAEEGARYSRWDDHVKVARFLFQMKEYDRAEELYRKLLRRFPHAKDVPLLLLDIGKCEVMRKAYEDASKTFATVCEEYPSSAYVYKANKYRKYCLKKLQRMRDPSSH